MFLGKHQPFVAQQMPMGGPMGMTGLPLPGVAGIPGMHGMGGMYATPEVSGYAHPGMYGGAALPGYEGAEVTGPGMAETVHATRTEYDVAGCPPIHFGHTEFEVEREPRVHAQVHIVRKGETVYKIAKRYGLDWREIAGYNHLGNPNLIYPGQRLLIPSC